MYFYFNLINNKIYSYSLKIIKITLRMRIISNLIFIPYINIIMIYMELNLIVIYLIVFKNAIY